MDEQVVVSTARRFLRGHLLKTIIIDIHRYVFLVQLATNFMP